MKAAAAAAQLLAARESGVRLDGLPLDCRPETVAQAHEVHDLLIDRLGLGGWKVGKASGPSAFSYAPVFAGTIFPSGARLPKAAYAPRLVEIELAFRAAEAGALEPFLLIEIVSSRFTNLLAVSPLELLADSSASGALLLGDALGVTTSADAPEIPVEVRIDGHQPVAFALAVGEPLSRALWLVEELKRRGRPLAADQIITTGAQIAPALAMTGGSARAATGATVAVRFD